MKYKLSRVAGFIDKYGLFNGIRLYANLKLNRLSGIKVPGINKTLSLRKNTSDVAIFDQVFLMNDYNLNLSFIPRIIVDAGAHVGLFSIIIKNKFPESEIICIEPGRENYEALNQNLAGYKNVQFVHAGLWSHDTMLNLKGGHQASHSGLVVEEDTEKGNVPGISVNTLMRSYHLTSIDILKIDIETSEAALFYENYEQWLPKVRVIIIELHDWMKEGCAKGFFEAINSSLKNYTYAVFGENTVIENKDWKPGVGETHF